MDVLGLTPYRGQLEEWRMALQEAQHFNDLLLRLRAFGLPLIATVAGAGFALGLDVEIRQVDQWVPAAFVTFNALLVPGAAVYLLFRQGWGRVPERAAGLGLTGVLVGWERSLWCLAALVAVCWAVVYWSLAAVGEIDLTEAQTFSAAPLVLLFALAVLLVIYFLDRFYYYKLLLGAVNRASQVERDLKFRLTDTITAVTAPHQSAAIVTLVYFVPGMLAYMVLLLFVVLNPEVGQLPS